MELDILIVDDDQVNNFVLKNIIQRTYPQAHIYVQREANAALFFLAEIRKQNKDLPGIILLDINMPVMSGFDFLDAFHEQFSQNTSHIYMVSSSISKYDQQKANSYPSVFGYITKPLVNQNIVFIVEEYLQSVKK